MSRSEDPCAKGRQRQLEGTVLLVFTDIEGWTLLLEDRLATIGKGARQDVVAGGVEY